MAATRKPGTSSGASRKKSKPAAAPARNGAPEARAVSFEAVQRRAYELFLARGGWHGADLADWLAAERELKGLTPARD